MCVVVHQVDGDIKHQKPSNCVRKSHAELHIITHNDTIPHFYLTPTPTYTQATTAGAKEQEAVNFLEKKFKNDPQLTTQQAVELAISTLQHVLSEDLKSTDIEVCVSMREKQRVVLGHITLCKHDKNHHTQQVGLAVDEGDCAFRMLSQEEIEEHLVSIAERD